MFASLLFPSDTYTQLTGHVSVYDRGHRQQSSKSAALRQGVTWKECIELRSRPSDNRHKGRNKFNINQYDE